MLRFNTQDVIKRAKELADLQNSDFITWEENMHLLDESYKKLYQEVINANDKYYVQEVTVNDLAIAESSEKEVRYYLPEDFYQLQSITIDNGSTMLLKKALTESKSSFRYDFINNTLILYGGVESRNPVIAYYPVPKTLTLAAPDVKVSLQYTPLRCCGTRYLTYDSTSEAAETPFFVEDIETGEIIASFTKDMSTVSDIFLGKRIAGFTSPSGISAYDFIGKQWDSFSNSTRYALKDGYAYRVEASAADNTFVFFKENLITPFLEIKVTAEALTDANANVTFDESSVYSIIDGKLKRYSEAGIEELYNCSNSQFLTMMNGDIYCFDDVNILKNGVPFRKDLDLVAVWGFNKVDFNTGYGISVSTLDDDLVHVISCFEDTELNFPNNFHFTYLAYQLAIAYKAKQNADASALITRSGEEAALFYDSMSRDTAENFRIQNVYSNGGIY